MCSTFTMKACYSLLEVKATGNSHSGIPGNSRESDTGIIPAGIPGNFHKSGKKIFLQAKYHFALCFH